jgi:RNA polymerase sigma factor (TIGR02999 family)
MRKSATKTVMNFLYPMTAMNGTPVPSVSVLLEEVCAGNTDARSRLLERVYDELRGMARHFLRGESPSFSLQSGDVVAELFLRLFGTDFKPENRSHFFGAAAKVMREVVVDHARKRRSQKRGANRQRVRLDEVVDYFERQNLAVEAVHEALEQLAAVRPRQSQVLTLRYFFAYTVPETAALIQVSEKTVQNDERFARAWLRRKLVEL